MNKALMLDYCEDGDLLLCPDTVRKGSLNESAHSKAPVRINRSKFPCDFFEGIH